MKQVSLFLVFLALTVAAQASENLAPSCASQKVFWDSDGHSPYQNYAECVGVLHEAADGTSQIANALTNEEAGGVGFATFQCQKGEWKIEQTRFNQPNNTSGYCAD